MISGEIVATIERWIDCNASADFVSWTWWVGGDNQHRGFEDTLRDAAAAVARSLGRPIELPVEFLAAYGEAPATVADPPTPADDLAERLARVLAEVVDVAILTVDDADRPGHKLPLRLAHFHPDLAERACGLLEEAAH